MVCNGLCGVWKRYTYLRRPFPMVAWFGDGGLIMIVLTPTQGGDAANVLERPS